MGEIIQFMANTKDWKAIKKINIDENVKEIDIISFLGSVALTFDVNVETFLAKIVDLKLINKYANDLVSSKIKKEEEFAKILIELSSVKLTKFVNSLLPDNLDNKEKNILKTIIKIVITRKILRNAGLEIDFTNVPVQGNKKKK